MLEDQTFDILDPLVINIGSCSLNIFDGIYYSLNQDFNDYLAINEFCKRYNCTNGLVLAKTNGFDEYWFAFKFKTVEDKILFMLSC